MRARSRRAAARRPTAGADSGACACQARRGRARCARAASASPAPASSSGSITFSSAVSAGSSWNDWNTKPSRRWRIAARSSSDSVDNAWPSSHTSPEVGWSSPASRPSSVVLPEPDAPTIAIDAPGLDGERNVVEDRQRLVAALDDLGQGFGAQDRCRHGRRERRPGPALEIRCARRPPVSTSVRRPRRQVGDSSVSDVEASPSTIIALPQRSITASALAIHRHEMFRPPSAAVRLRARDGGTGTARARAEPRHRHRRRFDLRGLRARARAGVGRRSCEAKLEGREATRTGS